MTPDRFREISKRYPHLRIAVLGDYCLDRYLEIDPAKPETSIETGRPVHNVTRVRFQPGGAGTILNNLAALGIGEIIPIGFCGRDAEGHELHEALAARKGVNLNHFLCTPERRTFTYCKPLLMHPGTAPEELNRLDFKNWSPTPHTVTQLLIDALETVAARIDALIVLDQVDEPDTGVVTAPLLKAVAELAKRHPTTSFIGDSRRGFTGWPAISYKMNAAEFRRFTDSDDEDIPCLLPKLGAAAKRSQRPSFVTRAEDGIISVAPDETIFQEPALPTEEAIDIVGAGDAVSANLTAALAAGAAPTEAAFIANRAASVVVHKLGTTGTATVAEIQPLIQTTDDQN
jgi:rfaE bifunctional protein kinase chain/domain